MPSNSFGLAGRLLVLSSLACAVQAQSPTAASPDFFETKIRPVMANNCWNCHGNSALGGLRLDSREGLLKGGKSGPSIVPGEPDKSLLITAIRQTGSTLKMPQGGKLKDNEINDIVAWVKGGAVWPASTAVTSASQDGKYVIAPERRNF